MRSFLPLVELTTWDAGFDVTGVHADVGEPAEERVRSNLERQRRERLVGVGLAGQFLLFVARSWPIIGGTSSGDGR